MLFFSTSYDMVMMMIYSQEEIFLNIQRQLIPENIPEKASNPVIHKPRSTENPANTCFPQLSVYLIDFMLFSF